MTKTNHFDQAAKTWDEKPRRIEMAKAVGEAIKERVPVTKNMQMIDFGCGTGLISLLFSEEVNEIIALDTSQGMLDVLQSKLENQGIHHVTPTLVKENEPSKQNYQADLLVSSMVLHHVADLEKEIKTISSWIKPGGYIALSDLEPEDGSFHASAVEKVHHGIDPVYLKDQLKINGITTVSVTTVYRIKRQNDEGEEKDYPIFLLIGRK